MRFSDDQAAVHVLKSDAHQASSEFANFEDDSADLGEKGCPGDCCDSYVKEVCYLHLSDWLREQVPAHHPHPSPPLTFCLDLAEPCLLPHHVSAVQACPSLLENRYVSMSGNIMDKC